ncbi:MAG: AAA family ATPase, partial [Rickettsiales bacterium]|nr:AAA family ATPase [Rickettsiales bacterium]
ERAIEKAEERLGLQNQPRAIVFHEKEGRRHCHVVWSRIDVQTMTAKQMSYDHRKLVELSRELYLEHGWEMPDGLKKHGERDPTNYTHAEYQQAKRAGKNAAEIKADIQAAWNSSDNRKSLEHALAERGYYLAQGDKRGYVVVDKQGEIYSLPKQLPKGINTKQVRERVGEAEHLPHVSDLLPTLNAPAPDLKTQALDRLDRYHSAFTFVMADRCLKPLIADQQARHNMIDELLQSKDLLKIGTHNGLDVHATQNMVDLEKSMLKNASDMAKISSHKTNYHAVERAIFRLNNKIAHETNGKAFLSQQQKQALHHITNDKRLSLLVGVAGAGKTTIMEGAKEALEAQGYRVLGAAPTGIAAAGLKDIGMTASTLHSLQYRMELAREILDQNEGKPLTPKQAEIVKNATLSKRDVLIIDEAGMVPAKQLANIIELTKQSGAKLVLAGDPAQLQSIEAGTAFKDILERNHHASLTEIRRQRTDWQCEATSHLSKGNVADALQSYDKNKCIIKAKTRDAAKDKLVKDFMKAHKSSPEQNRLVLASTRFCCYFLFHPLDSRGKVQE